jgi:predicted transcriptional regulator
LQRSYIELYVDILKALADNGPLGVAHIARDARLDFNVLKEYLDYFLAQGLVEGRKDFLITKKGFVVFRFFLERSQVVSIMGVGPESQEIVTQIWWGQKVSLLLFFNILSFLFAWENMSRLSQIDGVAFEGTGGLRFKSACFKAFFLFGLFFGVFRLLQLALYSCVFVANRRLGGLFGRLLTTFGTPTWRKKRTTDASASITSVTRV